MPELRRTCQCRKPAPGMLLDAAAELDVDPRASWMIGDTDGDVAAGAAAGCRTVLIATPAQRAQAQQSGSRGRARARCQRRGGRDPGHPRRLASPVRKGNVHACWRI